MTEGLSATTAWLAALGTAGLQVLDPLGDGSPVFAEAEDYQVIFDGILYNGPELRARFADRLLREPGDADLMGEAYRCWGDDMLLRISGKFALLVWDRARTRLLAARDALGTHPLFHARASNTLLFSPSIEKLLRQPGVSREINRARLVDYLARDWLVPEETCFDHVTCIAPGHALRVERGVHRMHRYWNPVSYGRPIEWIPDADAQERFDALLEQAVARCLTPGPAGIYLSGGLDSTTVATVAADICRRTRTAEPRALSLAFPGPYDEKWVQQGVASGLGLSHAILPFEEAAGPDGIVAAGLELSKTLPAPLFNIWAPAFARLSLDARQQGCKVILTGEGGDEWLGVSPYFAADLFRSLDVVGVYRLWRTYARSYPSVSWAKPRGLLWRFSILPLLRDTWLHEAVRRFRQIRRGHFFDAASPGRWIPPEPWIAPDPALRTQLGCRFEAIRESRASLRGSSYALDIESRLDDPRTWLRTDETYVLGRRSGIGLQDPFWDADLVDLLARIRPGTRNREGFSKALVRSTAARRFPDLGFENQRKQMLGTLIRSVMSSEANKASQILGDPRILGGLGVIDARRAGEFLAAPGTSKAWRVWDLLNLETWARAPH